MTSVGGFSGLGGLVLRSGLAVHLVGSLAFWIAQPRGFDILSRSFVEHQAIAPALFAASAAGLVALALRRPRTAWIVVGLLGGFWAASAAVIVTVGSTPFASVFWVVLAATMWLLLLAWRRGRPDPPGLITGGTVAGVILATVFWMCSWAPPATTRPRAAALEPAPMVPGATSIEEKGVSVSVAGTRVAITAGSHRAVLWPGFDYYAVSDAGFWSVFQFRGSMMPDWTRGRTEDGAMLLVSEDPDFLRRVRIRIENRTVRVLCETLVKREIASHLSSVMQLQIHGEASVEGVPWKIGHTDDRSEFVAIRGGRVELLRASSREKGPFETLGSWERRDPALTIDGWKVQVVGWAEQGSDTPSPTAGWGVSQACIERSGTTYFWSLAATSIGRGWHTVRTAPGVYVLEAILTPP